MTSMLYDSEVWARVKKKWDELVTGSRSGQGSPVRSAPGFGTHRINSADRLKHRRERISQTSFENQDMGACDTMQKRKLARVPLTYRHRMRSIFHLAGAMCGIAFMSYGIQNVNLMEACAFV
ncbi:predicted protein [Postia placenta Mad-698-R]|nr:predicted protein [Postia placenta Mad-698-R]